MGMSIDKCIEKITHEKQCFIDECWHNNGELEAYDMAIEIMRKYQKIEEILNEDFEAYHPLDRNSYRLSLIREVLKDGKID